MRLPFCWLLLLLACRAAWAQESVKTVPADDQRILYVDRADKKAAGGPRVEWPASEVRIRFRGTMLRAEITDTGKNRYTVTVDDGRPVSLGAGDARNTLQLAGGLDGGEHTVRVVKNSGVLGGIVQFHNFATSAGGEFLPARPRRHRIEMIGDSLSTGAGDEGQQPSDHITMHNANAALAYGSVAAQRLAADYTCVAVFGKRMAQQDTLPDIYDR